MMEKISGKEAQQYSLQLSGESNTRKETKVRTRKEKQKYTVISLNLIYNLESSSSKKELLTALFESSVIRTLMLDITCK